MQIALHSKCPDRRQSGHYCEVIQPAGRNTAGVLVQAQSYRLQGSTNHSAQCGRNLRSLLRYLFPCLASATVTTTVASAAAESGNPPATGVCPDGFTLHMIEDGDHHGNVGSCCGLARHRPPNSRIAGVGKVHAIRAK
jgi:hypothetical protein